MLAVAEEKKRRGGMLGIDPEMLERSAAPAPWPVTPGEMLGLTATDCCVDCTLERCAITGKPYCGHPNKGGLWPQDKVMPEIVERFNKARKKLLHAEVDRRP